MIIVSFTMKMVIIPHHQSQKALSTSLFYDNSITNSQFSVCLITAIASISIIKRLVSTLLRKVTPVAMLGFVSIKVDAASVAHDTLGNLLLVEQPVVLFFVTLVQLLQLHTASNPGQTGRQTDPGRGSRLEEKENDYSIVINSNV